MSGAVSSAAEVAEAVPGEVERLRSLPLDAGLTGAIRAAICSTIFPMIADLGAGLASFSAWAEKAITDHSDHLDDHELRLSSIEEVLFGDGTKIAQDDADVLSKVCAGARIFAEKTIESDPGNEHAKGLLELCDKADEIIQSSTFDDEDDDDVEDGQSA